MSHGASEEKKNVIIFSFFNILREALKRQSQRIFLVMHYKMQYSETHYNIIFLKVFHHDVQKYPPGNR